MMIRKSWVWLLVCAMMFGGCLTLAEGDEAPADALPPNDLQPIYEFAPADDPGTADHTPGNATELDDLTGRPEGVEPLPDPAMYLSFWQDIEVELRYFRDEESGEWTAEPLPEPVRAGVYVTNTGDQALGPILIEPDASHATDAGGLFGLSVEMEPGAEYLYLKTGESARVATYTFTGQGGTTDSADAQTLFIGFSARLLTNTGY